MKNWFLKGAPLVLGALMMIPTSAMAATNTGSLGEAMKASINQNVFTYQAEAELKVARGGSSYTENGNISFSIKDFERSTLPDEFAGASFVKMGMDFMGTVLEEGETTYVGFENIKAESDSADLMKMLNIFNEMIKFMDGKWMKFSNDMILKTLKSTGGISTADKEALAVLEGFSQGLTVKKLTTSFAELMDKLIQSEVLVATKSTKFGSNRHGGGFGKQTALTYKLGNQITAEGARTLKNGLVEFVSSLVPMIGEEIRRDLANDSDEEIAAGINEVLKLASTSKFEFTVVIGDRKIINVDLQLDLRNSGIPLTYTQTMAFNYGRGPTIVVPAAGGNLIDFDKVMDGVASLARIGQSQFSSNAFEPEAYSGLPLTEIPEYNPGNPYASTQTVMNMFYNACNTETRCRQGVAREMLVDAKRLYDTNRLTKDEYKRAINTIREANRRQ